MRRRATPRLPGGGCCPTSKENSHYIIYCKISSMNMKEMGKTVCLRSFETQHRNGSEIKSHT